jgi:hypothetical protein
MGQKLCTSRADLYKGSFGCANLLRQVVPAGSHQPCTAVVAFNLPQDAQTTPLTWGERGGAIIPARTLSDPWSITRTGWCIVLASGVPPVCLRLALACCLAACPAGRWLGGAVGPGCVAACRLFPNKNLKCAGRRHGLSLRLSESED